MRSKKHILSLITVALVVALSFAATAHAETTVSPIQFSEAPLQFTTTNVSVATSNGHGKLMELADVHDSAEKHSSRCHEVKSGWNSGENANGELWWFLDHNMLVCPSKSSPTGWAKEGGGMTGRACGNPVRLTRPPRNVTSRKHIKLVAHLHVTATVHVSAIATATGTASASAKAPGCEASSSVNGSGSAIATAEASATSSSVTNAVAKATAAAKIAIETKKKSSAYASAKAEATATINGKASALCSTSKTPPPPPTCEETHTCKPPSCEETHTCLQPPSVNNLQLLQEAIVSKPGLETKNVICADVFAPSGDSLTVSFRATYGRFEHKLFHSPNYGPNSVCDTYVSPSEIPPGGSDPTSVFVRDNTTGLTAESETVNQPIVAEEEFH